jgi:hypothetical protein
MAAASGFGFCDGVADKGEHAEGRAKKRNSVRQPRGNDRRKTPRYVCHSRASSLLAREESRFLASGFSPRSLTLNTTRFPIYRR